MENSRSVYFSLGSNLGNRLEYLRFGMAQLAVKLELVVVSTVFETEAWGYSDSAYLNIAACFRSNLPARELMQISREIEQKAGRLKSRKQKDSDYQARTLDIDILFIDQEQIEDFDIEIPHPRLHLRNFVLYPLAEIDADFIHPVLKRTIGELKNTSPDKSEIKRFERGI